MSQKESRVINMVARVYKRQHFVLPIIGLLIVMALVLGACGGQTSTSDTTSATSTSAGESTPTPQVVHYPPTTQADLQGLAAEGDATALHEFDSESVGLTGACPQPKREVTVDLSVTGQQFAEDLLAYFYAQQLNSPCGSVVFSYHNQSEAGDAYTAGRILLDVADSTGAANLDPNATNLKYTLTLDIGGVLASQQEY